MAVKASGANVNLRLRGTAGDGETDINEEINGESTDANANVSLATLSTGVGFDTTDGGHKMSEFFGYASFTPTENFGIELYSYSVSSGVTFDFAPDLFWLKSRGGNYSNILFDSVRGIDLPNDSYLRSDNTSADVTHTNRFTLSNGGKTMTIPQGSNVINSSAGSPYVAWGWKAGGAAVSGTGTNAQSITYSANPSAGFSIVKFSSNGSSSYTASHGLNQEPDLVITKATTASSNWLSYVRELGTSKYLFLDTNAAAGTYSNLWNGMSSTNIAGSSAVYGGTNTFINYCFHSVNGYQKIGTYTGTGQPNNDVTTGFRPRYVMIKSTAAQSWNIVDSVRNPSNPANLNLQANNAVAESSTGNPAIQVDFDNTGFSLVAPAGTPGEGQVNSNGSTYIYLAIA